MGESTASGASWVLPAVPSSVRELRRHAAAFAAAAGASEEIAQVVALAVSESVTNAVVHAYVGTEPGLVSVRCRAEGGWPCGDSRVQAGQEGVHVIDVSDPTAPDVEAFIDLPCGSHTATGVPDPANDRLILYSTPSSGACDGKALEVRVRRDQRAAADLQLTLGRSHEDRERLDRHVAPQADGPRIGDDDAGVDPRTCSARSQIVPSIHALHAVGITRPVVGHLTAARMPAPERRSRRSTLIGWPWTLSRSACRSG